MRFIMIILNITIAVGWDKWNNFINRIINLNFETYIKGKINKLNYKFRYLILIIEKGIWE